jgi:DNA polymerase elongation subunit (family B)
MNKPRILLFDIETSPNLAYVWGKYQQDVIAYEDEWQLLSVAWKWLGKSQVFCETQKGGSDLNLVVRLHDLFNQADVIVAHNGDEFDIKKVKARFLAHDLPPTKPLATVDTLKVAKKYFRFNSNKLDDIARSLKIGRKVKHSGFDLWLGCMKGNKKAWAKMEKYNKRDVVLLEKVYKKLRPWMERHPNMAALYGEKTGCPHCGNIGIVRWGYRATATGLQQRMLCKGCGAYHLTKKRG